MSKLPVNIDYIKLSQYVKVVECYMKKITEELDKAVIDQKKEWFCEEAECFRYFNKLESEECCVCKRNKEKLKIDGEDRFMSHIQKYGY